MSDRVDRAAVVLAAGRARRLGGDLPKGLLPVGEEPLVGRLCRQLLQRGLPVTIVVGHRAGELREALAGPGVAFVPNPIAARSDLGWSCLVGLRAVHAREALVVLGDTVTEGALFDRVLAQRGELVLGILDHALDDEAMKVRLDGRGRPCRISKSLTAPVHGEFSGVMAVRGPALEALVRAIEAHDPRTDLCEGPLNHVFPHLDVRAVDCSDLRWIEIDFPADVVEMTRLFGRG